MSICVKKISITDTGCECVVNAANEHLMQGGGVCGFIFRAAGAAELQEACYEIGHCPTGQAVITLGFELCDYIIHAVGPIYNGGQYHEAELLQSCYLKALDLAREYNVRSIAFPLISAGIYGYPLREACDIAISSCYRWLEENDYDVDIVFAVIDDEIFRLADAACSDGGAHSGSH